MSHTFCTLFHSNYLYKGVALYQSLMDSYEGFALWVLCMDDTAYSLLERMQLRNLELIRYEDLENEDLRAVKPERSIAEFCWTCTPPLCEYVMARNSQAPHVTYLDADLMFYRDPTPIYDELGDNSILIVPHRHSPEYKAWEKTSGIYNVSMVIFRNDLNGKEGIAWWRERCLEACRLDEEAGLCGDQKYLDDWPTRFENVVVLQNKGGGLAPWNIANYQLSRRNGSLFVDSDELIFYHYHSLDMDDRSLFSRRLVSATKGYRLTSEQRAMIYSPYLREVRRAIANVRRVDPEFESGFQRLSLRDIARTFRRGNLMLV